MTVQTSAGSSLSIGTTATNPIGDTYTVVNEITNLGMFGRSYEEVKYNNLLNRNVIKFKGQRDDGDIQLDLGRFATDAGQAAIRAALDVDADYNFNVTLNDPITPALVETVTISVATPGVVTQPAGAPTAVAGTAVSFSTTGILPNPLVIGQIYYVVTPAALTFEVALTPGGPAINTTATPPQSGVHTATLRLGTPTTFYFKAKVMGYQTTVGAANQVVAARTTLGITSGSIVEVNPS